MKEKAYALIGTAGSLATIFGFFGITPEMIGDSLYRIWYFASPILCLVFGIFTGWNAHKWYLSNIRKNEQDKKIDELERIFLAISPKQKQYVKEALEKGKVSLPTFDQDALTLCELGILGTPPYGMLHGNTSFSIQPSVIKEINEHKEWLNSNNPSQEVSA